MHTLSSPSSLIPLLLLVLSLEATFTWAASAADWRTRSIYQVITDRFALPTGSGIDPTACDPSKQQYCGGTWASITANLDYIQNMGFTAIWISPVNQNIPGPTAYGYPYHGYWIADLTQLNDQFGTEQDLINLSDELHKRGMYLMFDIVVNNVASTSLTPDYSQYMLKDAGVFCIGEVFGDPVPYTATYQGPTTLDSVLNFPQYSALTEAFSVSGPRNMSNLVDLFTQARDPQTGFSDPTLLGNFMENQDLPRWSNISVDPQSNWNALTFSFMSDGIPIVYYGQEQRFHGAADPMNREPLWPSGYASTPTMQFIQILNQLRNQLVNASDWATQPAQIISSTNSTIFLAKGYVLSVMTNIGSPPANMSANMVGTGFESGQVMIDVVTCTQVIIGSQGSVNIDYTKGGRAAILLPEYYLRGTTICPAAQALSYQASTDESPSTSGTIVTASPGRPSILISAAFAVLLGALSCLGSA
ncbi:hypothetical protein FRB94_007521 [Tulasnella sp. JGI-2019a]|nr:hypothetical protein FRB94_007521 [Tulasnella sp. JGI-2019a]